MKGEALFHPFVVVAFDGDRITSARFDWADSFANADDGKGGEILEGDEAETFAAPTLRFLDDEVVRARLAAALTAAVKEYSA